MHVVGTLKPRIHQVSVTPCSKRFIAVGCIHCLKNSSIKKCAREYIRVHGKEIESSQESPEPEQSVGVRYDVVSNYNNNICLCLSVFRIHE